MSEPMSDEDFLAKIAWEGGIWAAVEYGLKPTHLAENSPYRKPWERIIAAVDSVSDDLALFEGAIEEMNEEADDDDLEDDDESTNNGLG